MSTDTPHYPPPRLRTIIAGMRDFHDYGAVYQAMADAPWWVSVVLSGKATGVDALGEKWARFFQVPVEDYPADWEAYGRAAGPIRNREMASKAEALVAVWDGKSRGTGNMIGEARKAGLRIHIHRV